MPATSKFVTRYASVVDVPVRNIWGLLASWGSERLWMPECTFSSLEGFGIGSIREHLFTNRPGMTIRETLVAIDIENYTIRFKVDISVIQDALQYGNIKLTPVSETQTEVVWWGESDLDDETLKESLDKLYESFNIAIAEKLKA
ncbi:hypothetical protein HYQ46_000307 [Verticillium longisporum]|nr:hypothetical protein HYQ46_000307 [Verticillium longisporum]